MKITSSKLEPDLTKVLSLVTEDVMIRLQSVTLQDEESDISNR